MVNSEFGQLSLSNEHLALALRVLATDAGGYLGEAEGESLLRELAATVAEDR